MRAEARASQRRTGGASFDRRTHAEGTEGDREGVGVRGCARKGVRFDVDEDVDWATEPPRSGQVSEHALDESLTLFRRLGDGA